MVRTHCVPFLIAAVLSTAFIARGVAQEHRCIDRIYPSKNTRTGPEFQFDQTFAGDAGGAYSCDLQMRPSQLRIALDEFRNGVLYHDPRSLASVILFPIRVHVFDSLAVDGKKRAIVIRNVSAWYSFQQEYFTPIQKALVACSYLGNVTPTNGQSPGVMVGLGGFWFQSFVGSWKVKLTAVNIVPITPAMLSKACIPPGEEN